MLLDEYKQVPYKVINIIGAQINYGGRVTDDKDVRLINTILETYINPDVFIYSGGVNEGRGYYSVLRGSN